MMNVGHFFEKGKTQASEDLAVCMCMCMRVCLRLYVYACAYVCTCICVCVSICVWYVYVCIARVLGGGVKLWVNLGHVELEVSMGQPIKIAPLK